MLDEALKYIKSEVSDYFSQKLGSSTETRILFGNLSQINEGPQAEKYKNKIVVSLVNIEEDKLSKSPENFTVVPMQKTVYKNPKIYLNVYILFAINKDYGTATETVDPFRDLSLIVQCFQRKYLFTPENSPTLPPIFDRLYLELVTLSFEQLNHLWGVLGGKYLPSVLYKVKVIGIEDDQVDFEGGLIEQVNINTKHIKP